MHCICNPALDMLIETLLRYAQVSTFCSRGLRGLPTQTSHEPRKKSSNTREQQEEDVKVKVRVLEKILRGHSSDSNLEFIHTNWLKSLSTWAIPEVYMICFTNTFALTVTTQLLHLELPPLNT